MTVLWTWPLAGQETRVWPDLIGTFGAIRRHDRHAGIDLYCELGQEVVAVEDGEVIGIETFTGPRSRPRPTPWWNPTCAVLVRGKTGVVVYGEVQPDIQVGDRVKAGDQIAVVDTAVLRSFQGRPMVMLHLELYTAETTETTVWGADPTPVVERVKPDNLLDPTDLLLGAAMGSARQGLLSQFNIRTYNGEDFRDPAAPCKPSRWWAQWGGSCPNEDEEE